MYSTTTKTTFEGTLNAVVFHNKKIYDIVRTVLDLIECCTFGPETKFSNQFIGHLKRELEIILEVEYNGFTKDLLSHLIIEAHNSQPLLKIYLDWDPENNVWLADLNDYLATQVYRFD